MADTVTLHYTPSGGSPTSKTFNVLLVKGFKEPDQWEFFPPLQNEYRDGSMDDQFQSFRRVITIDFGVIALHADRVALLNWCLYTGRTIDYGTESGIGVVLKDPTGAMFNWVDDSEVGRQFIIVVKENIVRTTFPV